MTVPFHVTVSSVLERMIMGISALIAIIFCSLTVPFTLKSPLAIIVITTSASVFSPYISSGLLLPEFGEFTFFTVPDISDLTVEFFMEFFSFSSSEFLTFLSYSAFEMSVFRVWI